MKLNKQIKKLYQKSPKISEIKKLLYVIEKVRIIIFRPYSVWERKIFKSNGFFFTKLAKHQNYIQIERCHPQNSTSITLASCDMHL